MAGLLIPDAAKTDADKLAFCYRAVERLRLWHNERVKIEKNPARWIRETWEPRFKAAAFRLNGLRDQAMPYDDGDARAVHLAAERAAVKLAGLHDTRWDALIDVSRIVPLAPPLPPPPDPNEDISAYTEVDPNSHIGFTGQYQVDLNGIDDGEDAHVYRDFGAAYFKGDFTQLFEMQLTHGDANYGGWVQWCLANTVDDVLGIDVAGGDELYFMFSRQGADYYPVLREVNNGSLTQDVCVPLSTGTPYFVTMERDEAVGANGTLYSYIRTGSHAGALQDTLVVTLTEKQDWRYFYAVNTLNRGGTLDASGWSRNYDLGLGATMGPLAMHHYRTRRAS